MPWVDRVAATSDLRRNLEADGPAALVLTTSTSRKQPGPASSRADWLVLEDAETEFLLVASGAHRIPGRSRSGDPSPPRPAPHPRSTRPRVRTHVFEPLGELDLQDCGQLAIYVRRTNLL
ncbi:hypothetical protein QE449_001363 [Rhodococcus sp. SORGH_AS303]|nr:hypothetical protein [Rhodococcus sp. SORGH_AS_0301]MDQ1200745.1 hypothetical protein [Rhodococcus sp. SORGH_AS_0303]